GRGSRWNRSCVSLRSANVRNARRRSQVHETGKKESVMPLLEIRNLHARVAATGGREILKGVDLTIDIGQVHAIMGKNGSGKSTLCRVLAGQEAYEVTEGTITYDGKNLLELSTEERAREGLFLAFQYPVEIPGVSTDYFLKAAVNA